MQVFRYTDKFQEMLKCKVKAEPWMHVAIMKHPKTKGRAWYAVYVWDTRKVLAEGIVPNFNPDKESIGPGRYDGKYDWMQYARDNGKPLQGAKYDFKFDANDLPMVPLKITKPGLVSGNIRTYDVDKRKQTGVWVVGMTINGIPVGFTLQSMRFGVNMGIESTGKADVAGKTMSIFAKCQGAVGFYGNMLGFKPTLTAVGKPQSFIGRTYVMKDIVKKFVDAFVKLANDKPEIFSIAFKKAIGCKQD